MAFKLSLSKALTREGNTVCALQVPARVTCAFQGSAIPLIHSQLINQPGSAMSFTAIVIHSFLPQPMIYGIPIIFIFFPSHRTVSTKAETSFFRNFSFALMLSTINLLLLVTTHEL